MTAQRLPAAAMGLSRSGRRLLRGKMPSLAKSPLAPILGQRVPLRGPARMLFRSYARTCYQPGVCVERLTTKLGDLFDVDLSSYLEWQLWAFGRYEKHFAELFRCLVSPDDRCVDVGANVGVHTVRLAKLVGPGGEVIALEPDEEVARRARHNIMLNQLSNAHVINAAASDEALGEVQLYRPDAQDTNRARASLLRHSYLTGSATTVPVVTVDEVCPGPVALIKIDVEGYEAAVVRGAAATIDRYFPAVIFEYAPELLHDASQSPFGWLADRGYELLQIRHTRNGVTGRGRLALARLPELPAEGGNILAVPAPRAERLSALVH
jgi:FkbM family methyltransferase